MGIYDFLKNGFTTGESGGVPTQPSNLGGLLGDPIFQMGLGILAANNGRQGAGATVGMGALQGINNSQEMQTDAQRRALYEMQVKQMKASQDRQKRVDDWQTSFGKNNADTVTPGAYVNAPQGTNAPNFAMTQEADTVTPNSRFDMNKYMLDGVSAGAYSPLDLIKLQRGDHEYDFKDGVMFDKKTGANAQIGDGKANDTNDIKGYNFAKTPAGGNFKGTFEQYLQIKPALMAQVAGGQLSVAQQNSQSNQDRTWYETGQGKPSSQPSSAPAVFSTTVNGKTYSFKDQKSLNNFKLKAGVK